MMASFQHHDEGVESCLEEPESESWSSVTSRFQSDSPLSLRAELLERTSKIHSSGARERENYPLLLRRVVGRVGKYFKFLRLPPPPLAIMMPSRSKFRSRGELAIPGRRRKARSCFSRE